MPEVYMVEGRKKIVVDLWDSPFHTFLLIVKHPTGVLYSNQTGGSACDHPQVEGFVLPLDGGRVAGVVIEELGGLWRDIYDCTYPYEDLVEATNPLLDKLCRGMKLDLSGKNSMQEAWLHVLFPLPQPLRSKGEGSILETVAGVLTWTNSD